MTNQINISDVYCVALELSQSTWVCAFSPPGGVRTSIHRVGARDVYRLTSILETGRTKAVSRLDPPALYSAGRCRYCCKRIFSIRASNIDSRSDANAKC